MKSHLAHRVAGLASAHERVTSPIAQVIIFDVAAIVNVLRLDPFKTSDAFASHVRRPFIDSQLQQRTREYFVQDDNKLEGRHAKHDGKGSSEKQDPSIPENEREFR